MEEIRIPVLSLLSSQHFTPHMSAISRKLEEDATPTRHLHLHGLLKKSPFSFSNTRREGTSTNFHFPGWSSLSS